ncbi:ribosome small subunit-dependent GTPase A [Paenibacillus bovis]|uniref:Small ribosomal subunit biogenesis GTPase RsgA n=1 Tax=Paenibacillus bovis TaxID=1616788 RepID=A0A172ZIZ2_9BACL|nr:ribosome small subunit-dependent GTPase A [Paenibacillus bovis]ANF97605.1 ribosome small subunit-dependent GTPase A [Paenibacillus bovis]
MPEGLIVKALSGYYYVKPEQTDEVVPADQPATIQCRGRGIFKKRGESPLVGDQVIFSLTENGEGTVDKILPRRTELIRPPVANIRQAVLLFSVKEPDLSLILLDKFLVHIEHAGLEPLICFTKMDLLREEDTVMREAVERAKQLYEDIGYQVILTSAELDMGTDQIRQELNNKISMFAGQSGVGKSSLLNKVIPGSDLNTSEISLRLGRGKHTTRHVELIELEGGGYVADTPGFSQLNFTQLGVEDLGSCFREFNRYSSDCKFRGCTHLHEPGCKVLDALENGEIANSRYKHYEQFYQEMKDEKRRY